MAIRFSEADARPMGRNTSGVKGISLGGNDSLAGMVVAEPDATLLTACQNGYGKRTPFGPNSPLAPREGETAETDNVETEVEAAADQDGEGDNEGIASSSNRYRTQRRGGKGLRDIKTTERNGPVIGVAGVRDDDELLMMTARGKLQRIVAGEVSVIGRNTQGVRIMTMDEADTLAAIVRVPRDETGAAIAGAPARTPAEQRKVDESSEPLADEGDESDTGDDLTP
jgi:DNA gyrase subunit A